MTPKRPFLLTALSVCAMLIASCASSTKTSSAAAPSSPPQLQVPPAAAKACELSTLPLDRAPNQLDLEAGYDRRGAQLVTCDGKRDLAVQALTQEHQLQAEWAAMRACRRKPWWQIWNRCDPGPA